MGFSIVKLVTTCSLKYYNNLLTETFPEVTTPFFLKTGLSCCSFSNIHTE